MKTLTLEKILSNYKVYLTDPEINELEKMKLTSPNLSAESLKLALFGEEWNFMTADKYNPWSQDYINRINRKRKAFGISPVDNNCFSRDNSSDLFCKEVVLETKRQKADLDQKRKNKKHIVFVDMDNVLVNFQSGIDRISEEDKEKYEGDLDDVPGIFSLMDPIEGAIDAYEWLNENFDTYILSTAPWDNPSAWQDKLHWVKKHLPDSAYKRLILSHNKHLAKGDFLIDDRTANGAGEFHGKHVHFANKEAGYPGWKEVIDYMKTFA
ncbi:hypothetical protein OS188_07510 [Xanthomarina sp. F1114]|uniref:5' nucleotidase, NT5C type n=1 Tax=Xanthomarina sp. F1114 TaxID=2996019 RepID=UPI00225E24AF|nr:hypothetical protein [Xanthomarina sp. F1114]MCX7547795.1 hypothetical protein [Xanthomarina sp. F1114]